MGKPINAVMISKAYGLILQSDPASPQEYTPFDHLGAPVTTRLENKDKYNIAATIIQTTWRQYYRATHLHRSASLFGSNSKNSLQNKHRIYLPNKLRHLHQIEMPALFTTSTHSTYNLSNILHDGVIYPNHVSRLIGHSEPTDISRHDARLVCTSPFVSSVNDLNLDNFLIINTTALTKYNNNNNSFYFKLIDWSLELPSSSINICDNIHLTMNMEFPKHHFIFKNENNAKIASVQLAPEECVYHHINGLHNYLTLFIFKILHALPAEHENFKLKIYEHFTELDKNGALISHLQTIAKHLARNSELDFVNPITLNFNSIDAIQVNRKIIDLTSLRKEIASNNINHIESLFADAKFNELFNNSYMLTSGIVDYAASVNQPAIVDYLNNHFKTILTKAPAYTMRINSLESIPADLIQHVDTNFLAKKFSREQTTDKYEPHETVGNKTVYRPNHGLIHTLRVASYVPLVISALQQHGCNNLKDQSQHLDPLKIQKCLMFAVTGRENENGFYDNETEYLEFHQQSGKNFSDYYQDKPDFTPDELEVYKNALVTMGCPDNHGILDVIMNISHKLDLPRCYNQSAMEAEQIPYLLTYIESKEIVMALLNFSCECIQVTNDRLVYSPPGSPFMPCSRTTNHFVDLSFNSKACLRAIAKVEPPANLSVEQTHQSTFKTQP